MQKKTAYTDGIMKREKQKGKQHKQFEIHIRDGINIIYINQESKTSIDKMNQNTEEKLLEKRKKM